jgi:hypothetical protein
LIVFVVGNGCNHVVNNNANMSQQSTTLNSETTYWLDNEMPSSSVIRENYAIDNLIRPPFWIKVEQIPCGCIDISLASGNTTRLLTPQTPEAVTETNDCSITLSKRVSSSPGLHVHNIACSVSKDMHFQTETRINFKTRHEVLKSVETNPTAIETAFDRYESAVKKRKVSFVVRSKRPMGDPIEITHQPSFVKNVIVTDAGCVKNSIGFWERSGTILADIGPPPENMGSASDVIAIQVPDSMLVRLPVRTTRVRSVLVQPNPLTLVKRDNVTPRGRFMIRSSDGTEFRITRISLSDPSWTVSFDPARSAMVHWLEFVPSVASSHCDWEAQLTHGDQSECRGMFRFSSRRML